MWSPAMEEGRDADDLIPEGDPLPPLSGDLLDQGEILRPEADRPAVPLQPEPNRDDRIATALAVFGVPRDNDLSRLLADGRQLRRGARDDGGMPVSYYAARGTRVGQRRDHAPPAEHSSVPRDDPDPVELSAEPWDATTPVDPVPTGEATRRDLAPRGAPAVHWGDLPGGRGRAPPGEPSAVPDPGVLAPHGDPAVHWGGLPGRRGRAPLDEPSAVPRDDPVEPSAEPWSNPSPADSLAGEAPRRHHAPRDDPAVHGGSWG